MKNPSFYVHLLINLLVESGRSDDRRRAFRRIRQNDLDCLFIVMFSSNIFLDSFVYYTVIKDLTFSTKYCFDRYKAENVKKTNCGGKIKQFR